MRSNMEKTTWIGMSLFNQIHPNKRKKRAILRELNRKNEQIEEYPQLLFTTPLLKTFLMLSRMFKETLFEHHIEFMKQVEDIEDHVIVRLTPKNVVNFYGRTKSGNQWTLIFKNLKELSQTRSFYYQNEDGAYVQDITPLIIFRVVRVNNHRGRIRYGEFEFPRIWLDFLATFSVQIPDDFFQVLDNYHDGKPYHVSTPLFLLFLLGLRGQPLKFPLKKTSLFEKLLLNGLSKYRQQEYWRNAEHCATDLQYWEGGRKYINENGETVFRDFTPHENIKNESIKTLRGEA